MQLNTFARKHRKGCLSAAPHCFPKQLFIQLKQVTLLLTLSTGMTAVVIRAVDPATLREGVAVHMSHLEWLWPILESVEKAGLPE